jgi:hypothetical protein
MHGHASPCPAWAWLCFIGSALCVTGLGGGSDLCDLRAGEM